MTGRPRHGSLWWLLVLGATGCDRSPTATAPASSATPVAAPTASAAASASAAPSGSAAAPAPKGPSGKVLVFGDSITQADWEGHIAPEDRWVTRLARKSDRITAVNAGKNGRITSAIAELRAELARNPDARTVIILLGTNDMKNAKPGVIERATANVGKMIDLVRAQIPNVAVVVCAPPNIHVARLTSYWKEQAGFGPDTVLQLKALSAAYRTLAQKKHAAFVDLQGAVSPENIPDGVHPNGKGQVQIADAVWTGLAGE